MHVIINRIHFGNFRFIVDLEAGPEVEPGQLTLWVAEKVDVRTLPLHEFTLDQLMYSLKEPLRARLYMQLETEKLALQQNFAGKVSTLSPPETLDQKRTDGKSGNRARELRRQQEKALLHLEHTFLQKKLLTLDQTTYNLETLQAESHIFCEERFLHHFNDTEVDDTYIRQFCFQFAFDPIARAKLLAEADQQLQPARPVFE